MVLILIFSQKYSFIIICSELEIDKGCLIGPRQEGQRDDGQDERHDSE